MCLTSHIRPPTRNPVVQASSSSLATRNASSNARHVSSRRPYAVSLLELIGLPVVALTQVVDGHVPAAGRRRRTTPQTDDAIPEGMASRCCIARQCTVMWSTPHAGLRIVLTANGFDDVPVAIPATVSALTCVTPSGPSRRKRPGLGRCFECDGHQPVLHSCSSRLELPVDPGGTDKNRQRPESEHHLRITAYRLLHRPRACPDPSGTTAR